MPALKADLIGMHRYACQRHHRQQRQPRAQAIALRIPLLRAIVGGQTVYEA
ncbi:MAG: hypothetical protein HY681_02060 [Chloroflexi bacterium]|nr:hypothetical protein [Chloroflexota bacterium]